MLVERAAAAHLPAFHRLLRVTSTLAGELRAGADFPRHHIGTRRGEGGLAMRTQRGKKGFCGGGLLHLRFEEKVAKGLLANMQNWEGGFVLCLGFASLVVSEEASKQLVMRKLG